MKASKKMALIAQHHFGRNVQNLRGISPLSYIPEYEHQGLLVNSTRRDTSFMIFLCICVLGAFEYRVPYQQYFKPMAMVILDLLIRVL